MDKPVTLFYELCRLCLDRPGLLDILSCADLPEDIYLFTGVTITSEDNLPSKLCEKCLEVINDAKTLRRLALKNDVNLRFLFSDKSKTSCVSSKDVSSSSSSQSSYLLYKDSKNNLEKKTGSISSTSPQQMISIRKDLFDGSPPTSSPKKRKTPEKQDKSSKKTRIKLEYNKITTVFKCEICSKEFDNAKKVYLHERQHNKTLICPFDACGKKFALKTDLEKHIRVHTGEKPFQCELCDKKFTQSGTLKAHRENVHIGLS